MDGKFHGMSTYLDIDKVGRVVLPKAVRERYGVAHGGRVELVDTGQGMLLKPEVAAPAVTHLNNGFPVFELPAESKLNGSLANRVDVTDLADLVARSRAERDARNIAATEPDE